MNRVTSGILATVHVHGTNRYRQGDLMAQERITDRDIRDLVQRAAKANDALLYGDIDGYLALIKHADDYTLMAPFGGAPTHGFDMSREHRAALARFFKSGTADLELVRAYASGDMVVLALIERQ